MTSEYRLRGWWRDETFLDDLRRQARERPRKAAVVGRRVDEAHTVTLHYAELSMLTARFAGALVELGVQPGDAVAVQLPNRWEFVPLMFAAMAAGAVIVPIAPECRGDELRHRLALTRATVCVTIPEAADEIDRMRPELPLDHMFVVDGPEFREHFVRSRRQDGIDLAGRQRGPDEPFVVLFTSGTTGFSKGVVHSQNTVFSGVRGYADALMLDDGLVVANTTPLVHYSGFGQGVLAAVLLGGTVVFQDRPDHTGMLHLVERHRATLLYGPPPTLRGVALAQVADPHEVSCLRHTVAGSAPVLQWLVEEMRREFGSRTYSVWGMSEFGPITISRLDYDQDWAAHSHGRPIESMQVRIDLCHDPSRRAAVGRLRVRGASQALGYHEQRELFDAEVSEDGWFDTGDLAMQDGRGGIRILGRARDAILRDGIVAPVAELEATIAQHPKVVEAALVGTTHEVDGGILAVAVASTGTRPELAEITEHLRRAGQDPRFYPDRLEIVDVMPKTLTGKVRKVELRASFASGRVS